MCFIPVSETGRTAVDCNLFFFRMKSIIVVAKIKITKAPIPIPVEEGSKSDVCGPTKINYESFIYN